MNLVALNIDSIRLGHPLPFALRGESGVLLAHKGYVIEERDELEIMVQRGHGLFMDTNESGESHRTYLSQLHELVREDRPLSQIAQLQISAQTRPAALSELPDRERDAPLGWADFQARAHQVLSNPGHDQFLMRLYQLHADLHKLIQRQPDATLLALLYLSAHETRYYSATHAILVSTFCTLAARDVLRWNASDVQRLGLAGLSMNVGMTSLQDALAQQAQPPNAQQRAQIEAHAHLSAELLTRAKVKDQDWLEAVRTHHDRLPGPLIGRTLAQSMARLIHRADLFTARLAPRATRWPMSITAALQIGYFDETQKVDDAGAALIKGVGLYPPGAYVKLASAELGVVIRRGASPKAPRVAVLVNRQGLPTAEPMIRDTAQEAYKVASGLSAREVKVRWPLERLLALA